ncbi:hypothetical protein HDU96_001166 [Phlyctochytrium bullatum]|nr:hypothetical protein HDU96_001166 [Phlyctochytrium bullatum]
MSQITNDRGNRSGLRRPVVPMTPGNEWNSSILAKFGIICEEVTTADEFLGTPYAELEKHVNTNYSEFFLYDCPSFQKPVTWPRNVAPSVKRFLVKLGKVKMQSNVESKVDDLAQLLLGEIFNFTDEETLTIDTHQRLRLEMSNGTTQAEADVAISVVGDSQVKLLVQEDKNHDNSDSMSIAMGLSEAQLIAEAIAAFQVHNEKLRLNQQRQKTEVLIPAILMRGTHMSFYKIPVTLELSNAVKRGIEPEYPTIVPRYSMRIDTYHLNGTNEPQKLWLELPENEIRVNCAINVSYSENPTDSQGGGE